MMCYPVTVTIPQAIVNLRILYHEAQQAFAVRLGLSLGSLAYYEAGLRNPDLRALLKFGRSAEDIGQLPLERFFAAEVHKRLGRYAIQANDELEYERLRRVQSILDPKSPFQKLRKPLMKLLAEFDRLAQFDPVKQQALESAKKEALRREQKRKGRK